MVQQSPGEGGTMAKLAMLMAVRVQLVKLDELADNHFICLQYFQYCDQFLATT